MHVHVLRARTLYQHAPLLGCVCVGIFGTQGVGVLMLVPEPEVHAEEHSSEAYRHGRRPNNMDERLGGGGVHRKSHDQKSTGRRHRVFNSTHGVAVLFVDLPLLQLKHADIKPVEADARHHDREHKDGQRGHRGAAHGLTAGVGSRDRGGEREPSDDYRDGLPSNVNEAGGTDARACDGIFEDSHAHYACGRARRCEERNHRGGNALASKEGQQDDTMRAEGREIK
mmetsp:Transcript_27457/g.74596  ORF Transcript_27457/g.74596 Transcript_27457/m.74596 type:complete len:226 (+) Transcript_27457:590-1267(+)